jgi:alkylated DNA repair dioxygenase AlkB
LEKNKHTNLLPYDGELYVINNFIPSSEADQLYHYLKDNIPWQHETIKIFGKEYLQPRLTCFMGYQGLYYTYSGRKMEAIPFNNSIHPLLMLINNSFNYSLNSVLINYYRNGSDSMGWHRDNEKELGKNPVIVSLSLGETRIFKIRDYKNKKPVITLPLSNGTLLIMCGKSQTVWEHAIVKQKKVVNGRINLTFRRIIK